MTQTERSSSSGAADADGSTGDAGDTDASTTGVASYCPPAGVVDTMRAKYAMGIIAHLGDAGPLRYGELKERVDAPSDATLSRRLDQLAGEGLIARQHYDEIPPRVEYSLTSTGRELEAHLESLLTWAAGVNGR